ncbi:probable sodium/metabolite cotransporter BASS6, chloroplastic [Argentina anserina]|uniref:probable sodium/metabolite cotransporter BASS6, chloroplastic n=1 Tax=Argentina anserina TaxID=57926 RepID=UPI0021766C20|nr:probable sodium/metabolite cotransporter BASS6, chloroplastic [Potentilla anserina]XP_050376581.1 probable sodium/metabolite cotransporter BASS6, chloroplastic [Potentilla anserina]
MALHTPPTSHLHFQIRRQNLSRIRYRLPYSPPPNLTFSVPPSHSLRVSLRHHSITPLCRCASVTSSDSFDSDSDQDYASQPHQIPQQNKVAFLELLKKSSSFLPHVTIASTLLALVFPPSFTWFTNRYYAPALGFLMFAVGVNSSEKDFLEAFKRPAAIIAGYIGQFVVKPLLGYVFGIISVSLFGLPTPVGAGIMLVSCVSGAQLSNYATFLTDPPMAPLSIVMTSLSTATAVFVTPFLSLLLIGKRLPVDVKGMISSILQIVVTPIVTGLLLNRFLPQICNAIRPFLPPLSVLVTACCVGAPLAINIESVLSPFGLTILLIVTTFHLMAFIAGYFLTGIAFYGAPDVKPLQRTLSYETGMQSSLLALALANRFFQDPLVGVPPAISTVIMSLMGFSLVMVWTKRKE